MLSSLLLTAQPDLTNISMANAGIVALLGYGVVFFGLVLLMVVITLIGAVFIAIGLFISSLTEAQIIAAVGSIGVFVLLFLFSVLPMFVNNSIIRTVIKWFSVFDRFYPFTEGVFYITNIVYYISLTFMFIFLTIRVYEKRRWA